MIRTSYVRSCLAASAALALIGLLASPAYAQNGGLKGKVLDENGRPVNQAVIVFEQVGGTGKKEAIADKDGLWFQNGLAAGEWKISFRDQAKKLSGTIEKFAVKGGATTATPDVYITEKGGGPRGSAPAGVQPNLSAADAEKAKKEAEATDLLLKEANAALDAGRDDEAIEKLTALIEKMPKCGACFIRRGDSYVKKQQLDKAEADYKQAIDIDATKADPYRQLANLYNTQQKFDEAVKMSAKAAELAGAAGGGDATSVFNMGVIYWNQGKGEEALAQFEKAIQLDPKMAEAYYQAGVASIGQGKMTEAKARLTEYLKLAPNGPNAATAKAMIAQIK